MTSSLSGHVGRTIEFAQGVEIEHSLLLEAGLGLEAFDKVESLSSENRSENTLLLTMNSSNLVENGEALWSKSCSLNSNLVYPATAFMFFQITLKQESIFHITKLLCSAIVAKKIIISNQLPANAIAFLQLSESVGTTLEKRLFIAIAL